MGDRMIWTAREIDRHIELKFESWPEGDVNVYLQDRSEGEGILMSADKALLRSLGEYIKDTLKVMEE